MGKNPVEGKIYDIKCVERGEKKGKKEKKNKETHLMYAH